MVLAGFIDLLVEIGIILPLEQTHSPELLHWLACHLTWSIYQTIGLHNVIALCYCQEPIFHTLVMGCQSLNEVGALLQKSLL